MRMHFSSRPDFPFQISIFTSWEQKYFAYFDNQLIHRVLSRWSMVKRARLQMSPSDWLIFSTLISDWLTKIVNTPQSHKTRHEIAVKGFSEQITCKRSVFFVICANVLRTLQENGFRKFASRSAMSKFKCKCLNITVHVKEKATREVDGKAFVSQPVKSTFFSLDLFEVELAVGGITKVKIHIILCAISACLCFCFSFFLFPFSFQQKVYNQTVSAKFGGLFDFSEKFATPCLFSYEFFLASFGRKVFFSVFQVMKKKKLMFCPSDCIRFSEI